MNINFKPNKITAFLLNTQNTILSAAFVITLTSGLNAVLGLFKARILTWYFGVSTDLAVFYTAEKIPNLVYSILIVGAVSTVFIPVFTGMLAKNKEKAFKTASSIVNITFSIFFVFCAISFIWSENIIRLLAVGKFSEQNIILGSNLMRIMIVGQVLLVGGSLLTSLLQSFKLFLLPAIAPIVFNLGMIFGTIALASNYGIYAAAFGTIAGACLHLLIQIPAVKQTGFKFNLSLDLKDSGLLQAMHLVPPRLLSVFLSNVVGTINNSLAIIISAQSVVYLKLATQLQTLPVTLFGLAMASASLPTLSIESEEPSLEKFKKTFLTSLHQTMFLVIPLSAILFILKLPAVRLIYGVANFPWEATIITSRVLAVYSISIFSQSANYLITRAFYALKDTHTPVKISLITVFLNITLSYTLITKYSLGVEAVAWAFSITSVIDTVFLMFFLHKKTGGFGLDKLFIPFIKISFSALLMAITLYGSLKLLDIRVLDTTRTVNLVLLTGIAGSLGMATYLIFTKLFNVEEINLFYKLIRKLNLTKKSVVVSEASNNVN